jgi:hypothetical protein
VLRDATSADGETRFEPTYRNESHSSGVSWGAVIGGAFVSASFYLTLLALGAGMGLSSISPWSNVGVSASKLELAAIVWLIVSEIVASGVGGYLTGRLRTKWASIHSDEVHFRDTANGFLAWAVALVMTVTFLTSAATAMVGSAAAGAGAAGTAASATAPNSYFVDLLFRSDHPKSTPNPGELTASAADAAEAERIFANGLLQNQLPAADQSYLAGMITARTGISRADAEKRVAEVTTQAREAENVARKATARLLLCIFFMLITGAFTASLAATFGGRHRDHVQTV